MGKSATPPNLRHNNHRSDVLDRNLPVFHHFAQDKHRFNKHARFTLIESITETNNPKVANMQELLKKQENFWIRTSETLKPHRLNHELNPE